MDSNPPDILEGSLLSFSKKNKFILPVVDKSFIRPTTLADLMKLNDLTTEEKLQYHAGELYDTYCIAVGGTAHDGKPLPSWEQFKGDSSKRKQVNAWIEVAKKSIKMSEPHGRSESGRANNLPMR